MYRNNLQLTTKLSSQLNKLMNNKLIKNKKLMIKIKFLYYIKS